jgi:hypothetical protein
MNSSINSVNR